MTNAEIERLALLTEELGEAAQAVGKILRHGYASRHPDTGVVNSDQLALELGDVIYCMLLLCEAGDVDGESILKRIKAKPAKTAPYLHHQGGGGGCEN